MFRPIGLTLRASPSKVASQHFFDLRVVLVDEIYESLVRIGRKIERYGRAASLRRFPVGWYGVRFPGYFNILFEVTHLVVHLYPASLPVTNIDQPVVGYCQTVHG